VIVPTVSPERAARLLGSLAACGGGFETIVVDNGTGSTQLDRAAAALDGARVLALGENQGYSRAVNRAAAQAQGETLVLLNDDSTVEPGYVERIAGALDPGAGAVMAAGVMRDSHRPGLIDTAGMELDRTLLVFDYLNGEPVSVLKRPPTDPLGPSGAAAAFTSAAFLDAGGFDERLFAYWEDVDLVLRLRRAGGICRLAPEARGIHLHSATLGSGSARKDYLVGYGRGYVLRKWGVLSARRLPSVLVRDLVLSAGQAVVDRNLGGARGRLAGLRAPVAGRAYPAAELSPDPPTLGSTLRRRWRRRARLRRRAD
jgi:N-acetylglucosaminyl-diphospho-decaprenol L-rhamnosyltransferase